MVRSPRRKSDALCLERHAERERQWNLDRRVFREDVAVRIVLDAELGVDAPRLPDECADAHEILEGEDFARLASVDDGPSDVRRSRKRVVEVEIRFVSAVDEEPEERIEGRGPEHFGIAVALPVGCAAAEIERKHFRRMEDIALIIQAEAVSRVAVAAPPQN